MDELSKTQQRFILDSLANHMQCNGQMTSNMELFKIGVLQEWNDYCSGYRGIELSDFACVWFSDNKDAMSDAMDDEIYRASMYRAEMHPNCY